ncbi:MAG: hypothetical protein ABIQ01_00225 [Pseudolysinimonas sp.]
MPDAATASRRRPVFDARLLIGLALVIGSVAGVVGIVSAGDRRATLYAAASSLSPGDRIDAGDLVLRQVALDGASDLYLTPGDVPGEGLIVGAGVRGGELVPRSAVGSIQGERSTSLVLQLSGRVSAAVVPGAIVDVWSAPAAARDVAVSGDFGPPIVLTADAVVVRLVEDDGIVASSDGDTVEILVPRVRIARLLQAIANGDALAVVPAGIPLGDR